MSEAEYNKLCSQDKIQLLVDSLNIAKPESIVFLVAPSDAFNALKFVNAIMDHHAFKVEAIDESTATVSICKEPVK